MPVLKERQMGAHLRRLIATSFFIVCGFTLSLAQETEFKLASGRVGESYRQSIETTLAGKPYELELKSAGQKGAYEWTPLENLPPGLSLNSDGTITGIPQSYQPEPYRFKVRVTDRSMRDAEALELNFSIQMKAPQIKLVKKNAIRLEPIYTAPEQTSLPAGSTSIASGKGDASGDNAAAAPAQVAANADMNRATHLAPPVDGSDGNRLQVSSAANVNTQVNTNTGSGSVRSHPDINKYVKIVEEKGDGGKTEPIYPAAAGSDPRFVFYADRKSIIAITREAIADGVDVVVSADLEGNSPEITGGKEATGVPSGTPRTSAILANGHPTAKIDLETVGARSGDKLNIKLEIVENNAATASTDFTIKIDDYGFDRSIAPSIFLLNRPGIDNSDIPSNLQIITTSEQTPPVPAMPIAAIPTTDITNSVNYSPSPGLNYTFSFKPRPNKTGLRYKVLSLLEPGFGVNATFMDFNDQTLSFADLQQKFLTNQGSDVQLGLGGALSFLENNVQLTYGANLNAKRRRGYFAFGVNFVKLLNLVRP